MAAHEIIDLSLSTDDEGPVKPLTASKNVSNARPPASPGFMILSDELDSSIHLEDNWQTQPSKRRKLRPETAGKVDSRSESASANHQNPPPRPSTGCIRGKSRGAKATVELDPIVFISSPDDLSIPSRRTGPTSESLVSMRDDPDDDEHELLHAQTHGSRLNYQLSHRTAALLAEISGNVKPRRSKKVDDGKGVASESTKDYSRGYGVEEGDPEVGHSQKPVKGNASSRTRLTSVEKENKAQEKEREKERKVKEKEEEKGRKRQLKEEKAREKQIAADLAEVNKARTDKKISTPEMIVDLPSSMEGQSADTQIREILKGLQVQVTTYSSNPSNIIKWRRKVAAQFNEEMGHWEPMPEVIRSEKHVLCLLSAKELVTMASTDPAATEGQDLETHVLRVKSKFENSTPIYLIEGLVGWMRKNKNTRNRAYQAAVLSQMEGSTGAGGDSLFAPQMNNKKGKKPAEAYVDEDMVEDALLRLQVMHGCLIHHTAATIETVEWVVKFTQDISTIPYKTQRLNLSTSFCMDVGQVRTGDDKHDTFIKMLQEVVRVTAPIAYGIAAQYPNVGALLKGMRKHGPLVLENLKKSANKNGALTEARIGPALSRRLYKVFMQLDPGSTDV
ncbi:hypothetical protein MMC24_000006 [Lignoscripta atroalba]|nr:hypothetical protein [Lignoscripta atroalba]